MDVRDRRLRRAVALALALTVTAVGVAAVWLSAGPLAVVALAALAPALGAGVSHARRTRLADDAVEVEAAAAAPLLAHLAAPADPTVLPALDAGSAGAAAFGPLRVAVERRAVGVTVLTALGPGEGHVWVGANLAIALATTGRRVLLVDARLGAQAPGAAGLHDALLGAALDGLLLPGPVAGLQVLPPGAARTAAAAPVAELLVTRFPDVAAEACAAFDHVLVLAPALEASDHAQVMSAGAGLLITLAQGSVRSSVLGGQAHRLRAAGVRLLGVVLLAPAPEPEAR